MSVHPGLPQKNVDEPYHGQSENCTHASGIANGHLGHESSNGHTTATENNLDHAHKSGNKSETVSQDEHNNDGVSVRGHVQRHGHEQECMCPLPELEQYSHGGSCNDHLRCHKGLLQTNQ